MLSLEITMVHPYRYFLGLSICLFICLYLLTSGYAPKGLRGHLRRGESNLITQFIMLDFKRKSKKKIFIGAISLGRLVVPSPKIDINLPKPMGIYPVKESPIGSAVSKILWHTQTDN